MDAKFSCKSCGKSYKWKPEFAGKKVKCKCGYVMTAPSAPPVAQDEPDLDALYSLADDGKQAATASPPSIRCPSCKSEMELGAQVCTVCGFNIKTGKRVTAKASKGGGGAPAVAMVGAGGGAMAMASSTPSSPMLGYAPKKRGLEQEASSDPEGVVQEIYIPAGILAVGLILAIVQLMFFSRISLSFGQAAIAVVVMTVVRAIVLGIGFLAAIKMMDIALGAPGPAALKLLAAAIAPTAFGQSISYLIGDHSGFVGWALQMILGFILFKVLFDLDLGEVLLLSGITVVIQWLLAAFILVALVSSILPDAAVNAIGGASGGGGGKAKINDDVQVEEILDTRPTEDAKVWMNDNSNRMFGDAGHPPSVKLVDDIDKLGAKRMLVVPIRGEGSTGDIFVELPRDKTKRKAVFDTWDKFCEERKLRKKPDEGQDWLIMSYRLDPKKMGLSDPEEAGTDTDKAGESKEEDEEQ